MGVRIGLPSEKPAQSYYCLEPRPSVRSAPLSDQYSGRGGEARVHTPPPKLCVGSSHSTRRGRGTGSRGCACRLHRTRILLDGRLRLPLVVWIHWRLAREASRRLAASRITMAEGFPNCREATTAPQLQKFQANKQNTTTL